MDGIQTKDLEAFLTLNRLSASGRRRTLHFLSEGKSPRDVLAAIENENLFQGIVERFAAEKEIEICQKLGVDFLCWTNEFYPRILKEIPDPPLVLYKKGEIIDDDQNAIAIVGTRHPSFYGRTQTKKFAQELAAKGLTIVSGLARGIDGIAHDAALQISYGRTLAVMGCGMDKVYPEEHRKLFEQIAERGAVLSEYPIGTLPKPENFPRRNRILSGLTCATLVIEAHARSGSLITAHQAVEQGRDVFALPGPVDQLTSRGTNKLIKEGAYLVETAEDVLLVLADKLRLDNKFIEQTETEDKTLDKAEKDKKENFLSKIFFVSKTVEKNKDSFNQDEKNILEFLSEEGSASSDEILEALGLDTAQLPGLLLCLELAKKIRKNPEGRWALL